MIPIFLGRPELLASGEKLEQQLQWQKEEANSVQEDRKNSNPVTGGLFKGCFKQRLPRVRYAIRDEDDGVDRCPSCNWEIEDGMCPSCGYEFEDDGAIRPSFGGFSDMDPSERDMFEEEDLDGDIDLEDHDFDESMGFRRFGRDRFSHNLMDGDQDMGADQPYAVRRWLAHTGGHGAHRRRASHSARGSRQHSYTASLSSYSEDTEMGILEEEDEDDIDEDSSMSGFIDDTSENVSASTASQSFPTSSATSGRRRPRRVVDHETSGTSPMSSQGPLDDDDEGGPVSNGRRGVMNNQARRRNIVLSESDEGSTSTERNVEEERQNLLRDGWSSLDQDSVVDDVDDGEESDGARTTVGWEPTSISNDRIRNAGSLTPTADRPDPNSRSPHAGQPRLPRVPSGLRGLRHRSSILSTSTANPEEADDDDSEAEQADRDGDISMTGTRLRRRVSRAQMLQSMRFQGMNAGGNTGSGSGNGGDVDSDSTSDASMTPGGRRQRARQQEYNPRISWMFAQYQTDVREMSSSQQSSGTDFLEQMRAMTPVSRPRTANRQRQNTQTVQHAPSEVPTSPGGLNNMRMQVQQNAFTNSASYGAMSPRMSVSSNGGVAINNRQSYNAPRAGNPNSRPPSRAQIISNVPSSPITVNSSRSSSIEFTSRPSSRNTSRPNSAMGRRIQTQQPIHPQGFTVTPGLNFAARQFSATPSNPYAMYLRSNQRLQQQPSTATLRARGSTRTLRSQSSQAALHDPPTPTSPQSIRPQQSRAQLRNQPSQQRIRPGNPNQARTIDNYPTLSPISNSSSVSNIQAPPRPTAPTRAPVSNPPPTSTATSRVPEERQEERLRLARELIQRRTQELSNNPYAQLNRHRGTSVDTDGGSSISSVRTTESARTINSTSTSSGSVATSTSTRPAAPLASRVRAADNTPSFPHAWTSPTHAAPAGQPRGAGASIVNAINSVTAGAGNRNRAEQLRA